MPPCWSFSTAVFFIRKIYFCPPTASRMCTVTFIPRPSGFILTHNRDEAPTRSPQTIAREKTASDTLIFPRDTRAGGAWIVASQSGKTACLLNGAFVKHHHQPPYRRSRGLMLLDFFQWAEPERFFEEYDLEGIEPFTFLFFQLPAAIEFRWDGARRHLKRLSWEEPHFWCSATLYPADMQARRETVFRTWLQAHPDDQTPVNGRRSPVVNPSTLLSLHRTGSVGDPENDYIMNRGGRVRTVSITQIIFEHEIYRMRYFDLLEGYTDKRRLTASKRRPGA